MSSLFEAYITNLGKYNEGRLVLVLRFDFRDSRTIAHEQKQCICSPFQNTGKIEKLFEERGVHPMTRKDISDGVGNISTRHIQEAASYMAAEKKVSFFKKPFGRSMIAAVLALCILAGGITVLENFPLYCPKCRRETVINVKQFNTTVIKGPDAQTQSR